MPDRAVVALDRGFLLGLPRLDMQDGNSVFLSPFYQLVSDVFRAVVHPDREDKARDLKLRKVLGLGELVIATGADNLGAEELAGALIVLVETKDIGKKEAWAKRGAAFFRGRSRRSASESKPDAGRSPAQPGGAPPASGGTGAA